MTDSNVEERARKERSPSFPFITLRKAIDRAEAMLSAHRRSPARIGVVGETWSFSPTSSGLVQTIAALKAYGLLDDIGRGEDRRVQVSDLATRIINDSRPGAREAAIREAAVKPKILAEYLNEWLPSRPSDAHCISELTLDRGFNEDAAALFVRIFDDNASFAGLKKNDNMDRISENASQGVKDVPSPAAGESTVDIAAKATGSSTSTSARAVFPTATLPLPEGMVTMTIPTGLSDRSLVLLKSWIEVILSLATFPPPDTGAPM